MTDAPLLDEDLRATMRDRLAAFDVMTASAEGLHRAAVCIALVADPAGGAAGLVLCRRGRVGSHQGQWGLPGGRIDPGEDAEAAALRELDEEVGLVAVEVLGRLDDYVTRSGFHLSPFVVWCPGAQAQAASPMEIRSVHHVGLDQLVRDDSPRWVDIPESDRSVLQLPIGDSLIHAPTAAVLYQFAEVGLRARHTRVHDVEEPVFAWR